MAKLNDLTGKTFGSWLVLYRNGSTKNKSALWRCRCECGKEYDVVGSTLISGNSTKCRSCVPKKTLIKPHRRERIYTIYTGMKQRCHNPKSLSYKNYGAKGIFLCDEWRKNPDAFFQWAFANGYQDGFSIERINRDKGYSPDNCKWIPMKEQAKNRSCNVDILYDGAIYTLTDACKASGISYDSVRSRHYRKKESYQDAFNHFL